MYGNEIAEFVWFHLDKYLQAGLPFDEAVKKCAADHNKYRTDPRLAAESAPVLIDLDIVGPLRPDME